MDQDLKHTVADRARQGAQALPRTAATLLTRVLRPTSGGSGDGRTDERTSVASVEALLRAADLAAERAEAAQREAAALEDEARDRARIAQQAATEAQEIARRAQEVAERMAEEAAASADRLGGGRAQRPELGNELDGRTKSELLELAADAEIEGRSSMTKEELIRSLTKAEGRTS